MHEDLAALAGPRVGDATFGVVGTASRWLVPQLVERLREDAPGVRLLVHEGASERLLAELIAGDLAQAVVTAPVQRPRASCSSTSPTSRWSRWRRCDVELRRARCASTDLAAHRLVLPPAVNPLRAEIDAAAAASRGAPRRAGGGRGHPAHRRPRRRRAPGSRSCPRPRCRRCSTGCASCEIADLPPRRLGLATLKSAPMSIADRAVRDAVLEIVGWTRRT